ncbi:hypothetical protein L2E82_41394 [Cichorium intybus]|uniref:Uncharacterized protein n=1 Tax=Cichorium intybus TaxID=13427 RepID=A0ACB9AMC4_CICIN|nr:hypothetical protein L2E82_41394 [Cichorium intybus]
MRLRVGARFLMLLQSIWIPSMTFLFAMVKRLKRRNRRYIGRKIPGEKIGSDAKDSESVEFSNAIWRDWAVKSDAGKMNGGDSCSFIVTFDSKPRSANRNSGILVEFPEKTNLDRFENDSKKRSHTRHEIKFIDFPDQNRRIVIDQPNDVHSSSDCSCLLTDRSVIEANVLPIATAY